MKLARSLGGVISGEHGIGITKLEFLTDHELADFTEYKRRIDPDGNFNKGKLLRDKSLRADLTNAYTPSFGLMGHESLIMQRSDIGAIADSMKDCLRCGKCKPVCATHVPRANLLYSPRNKILATSLFVEAFLYQEQTRRGISVKHWHEFEDVADHCTVCHKCLSPCPVKIDFGDISMNVRKPPAQDGAEELSPRQRRGDAVPERDEPADDPAAAPRDGRCGLQGAAPCQRPAARPGEQADRRATLDGGPGAHQGTGDPLHQQEDARRPAQAHGARAARHRRPRLRSDHPRPEATSAETEAVFYFPGCGSERLFSQVGLATQAMLWHAGVQTVLPPGYLCCGYPQRGSGQFDKADKIITDNRVLFHRVANTLNYLDIKTIVVSCGTCYDQLQGYKFEDIFPGSRIVDIHEFLLEKGVKLERRGRLSVPRPLPQPDETASADANGESAARRHRDREQTLLRRERNVGVTRPDISTQVRFRKEEELRKDEAALRDAMGTRAGEGEPEDPDLVPELPARIEPLQGRSEQRPARSRLHRRRDGEQDPRARLDARVRGARERRRDRTGAGVAQAHWARRCYAEALRVLRSPSPFGRGLG